MTDAEKLSMLKTMTGEKDEDVLSTYLSIAGNKVLKRAYPFDTTVTKVPDQYAYNQVEIAAYLLNKRGAEGETAHIINLVHNLDCYDLHPGVTDDETLGRIYVEDMELLDVPDNVLPYFDFEAYGRDMRINEGGHFAPTGYLTRSGDFKEVYHGIEDIPAEHRIFAYPKLNIREQMAAYKEVIDRSSLEGERLHPRKEHDDR